MHPVTFQIKQTHLASVALGRRLFNHKALKHLTPARFDLLFAIRASGLAQGWARSQQEVRFDLRLSGATVSKMVHRMQELGFIIITRDGTDRRCNYLIITPAGRELYRIAWKLLKKGREVADTVIRWVRPYRVIPQRARVEVLGLYNRIAALACGIRRRWQGTVSRLNVWQTSMLYDFEEDIDHAPLV